MTTLAIADADTALRSRIEARKREAREQGIPLVADLPTLDREHAAVTTVRFDSGLRMADVARAAESIGCELTTDRRGQLVIRRRA